MANIKTRAQYIGLFTSAADAMAYERWVISSGEVYLPTYVLDVLKSANEPTEEYWQFMAARLAEANMGLFELAWAGNDEWERDREQRELRQQRQLEFDVEWSLVEGLEENQDVYYSDN